MLARLSSLIVFFAVCAVGALTACQPPTPRVIAEETSTAAPLATTTQPTTTTTTQPLPLPADGDNVDNAAVVASAEDAQVAGGGEGIVLDHDDAARIDAAANNGSFNEGLVAERPAVVARAAEVSTTGSASTYSSGYGFNVMPMAPTARITSKGTTTPLQPPPRQTTASTPLTPGSSTAEMVDGTARAAEVFDDADAVGAPYIDPAALARVNAANDAVAMAQLAAQRASRPELRAFAQDMNANGSAALQQQMSAAGVGTLSPSTSASALGDLNGDDFDRQYLQNMIDHHEAALSSASDSAEAAQLQRELGQLQGWYDTWY